MEKNKVTNGKNFLELLNELKKGEIIIFDEATPFPQKDRKIIFGDNQSYLDRKQVSNTAKVIQGGKT